MNRKIYREIAIKNKTSIKEVKQEMQAAINYAYVNPNAQAMSLPRKNAIPTIEEVVEYMVKQMQNNKNE